MFFAVFESFGTFFFVKTPFFALTLYIFLVRCDFFLPSLALTLYIFSSCSDFFLRQNFVFPLYSVHILGLTRLFSSSKLRFSSVLCTYFRLAVTFFFVKTSVFLCTLYIFSSCSDFFLRQNFVFTLYSVHIFVLQ